MAVKMDLINLPLIACRLISCFLVFPTQGLIEAVCSVSIRPIIDRYHPDASFSFVLRWTITSHQQVHHTEIDWKCRVQCEFQLLL